MPIIPNKINNQSIQIAILLLINTGFIITTMSKINIPIKAIEFFKDTTIMVIYIDNKFLENNKIFYYQIYYI